MTGTTIRVLLLGRHGQLAAQLLQRKPCAMAVTSLSRQDCDLSAPGTIASTLQRLGPFDAVINAAAYTAVDHAETDAATAFAVNGASVGILGEWAARWNAPIVHVSTDHVFDGARQQTYLESDAISPANLYGASKAAGESLLRAATARHMIVRTSWLYGASEKNFAGAIIRQALRRQPLRVVSDQFGCPTAVDGLADAIWHAMPTLLNPPHADVHGTFHYCDMGTVSRFDFAAEILTQFFGQTGYSLTPCPTPTGRAAKRPPHVTLDCSRLCAIHGIVRHEWRDTLKPVIQALRQQLAPATTADQR